LHATSAVDTAGGKSVAWLYASQHKLSTAAAAAAASHLRSTNEANSCVPHGNGGHKK
jgi:hypothetical protein